MGGYLRVIFAPQSVQENHQVRLNILLRASVFEHLATTALNRAVVFLTVGILLSVLLSELLLLLNKLFLGVLVEAFS